jgi:hypothetical protein
MPDLHLCARGAPRTERHFGALGMTRGVVDRRPRLAPFAQGLVRAPDVPICASRRARPVAFGARVQCASRDAGVGSYVTCSAISSGAVDDVHTCAGRAFPNLADRRVVASVPVQRRLHRRKLEQDRSVCGGFAFQDLDVAAADDIRPPAARMVSAARLCGWCCLFGSKPSCADPSPPCTFAH